MDISLKNLKYAAFASEETMCFEASIYIDGKREGTASNDGKGGPTDIWPESLAVKLNEYAKTLPNIVCPFKDSDGNKIELEQDADIIINTLVNKSVSSKELKRLFGSKIVFVRDGELRTSVKLGKNQLDAYLKHEDELMKKLNADKILNTMDFDSALKIYMGEEEYESTQKNKI